MWFGAQPCRRSLLIAVKALGRKCDLASGTGFRKNPATHQRSKAALWFNQNVRGFVQPGSGYQWVRVWMKGEL